MKVLFVHNAYGKRSGEEVVVESQAKLLLASGHDVRIFERTSVGIRGSIKGQVAAFFSGLGNKKAIKELSRILDDWRPDIAHVHNLYPWISPAVLPILHDGAKAVVMTVHNYRLSCPTGLMFSHGEVCESCVTGGERWCLLKNCEGSLFKSTGYALRNYVARRNRYYYDYVDHYAVLTNFQKSKLIEAGYSKEKISILPNTTDLPAKIDRETDLCSIGYVGRVSHEKGISILIDAMMHLPKIPCVVAGVCDGKIQRLGPNPANVNFLGGLDAASLNALYGTLRFIVVPSIWYEGFPMVVIEAMSHGKPVIASRIGGLPELIDDGVTGLLFEPGNVRELADKIEYLWQHPEVCREMGQAGREKLEREYNSEDYVERLLKMYANALKAKSCSFVGL